MPLSAGVLAAVGLAGSLSEAHPRTVRFYFEHKRCQADQHANANDSLVWSAVGSVVRSASRPPFFLSLVSSIIPLLHFTTLVGLAFFSFLKFLFSFCSFICLLSINFISSFIILLLSFLTSDCLTHCSFLYFHHFALVPLKGQQLYV